MQGYCREKSDVYHSLISLQSKGQVNNVKPFIIFVIKIKLKIMKCSNTNALCSRFGFGHFSETLFPFFIEADAKQFTGIQLKMQTC